MTEEDKVALKESEENTLKKVKETLNEHKDAVDVALKAKLEEANTVTGKKYDETKVDIKTLNEALDKVQLNLKAIGAQVKIPGLSEELQKKDFSFTTFTKALYKMADPLYSSRGQEVIWKGAEREKEMCDEYTKLRASEGNNTQSGAEGGILIPTEVSDEIIDLVHAMMPILKDFKTTSLRNVVGDFEIPKLTGRPTAEFVGENQAPTDTQNTYGALTAKPHRLAAFTKQSKRLIFQSKGVSDRLIKEQLALSMALRWSQALISGLGSEHVPRGLAAFEGGMSSNDVTLATNGKRFTITDSELMKLALDEANENSDSEAAAFLMYPSVVTGMKTERIEQFSGQGAGIGQPVIIGMPFLSDSVLKDTIGLFGKTTQIAKNLAKGNSTTLSKVYFGDWSKMWIMEWAGMNIRVSDQAGDSTGSAFTQNQLWIIAEQEVDSQIVREAAFTFYAEAETLPSKW